MDTVGDARDLPLRGFGRFSPREGRQTGVFVEAGQAPERVWCPEPLAGVTGAYAVRMPDGSMAPKYEAGQLLFIHPYRTPRTGDAVVVRLADGTFAVGRLMSSPDRAGVRLTVLCPVNERRFDAARVAAVDRIVFAEEP
ncbi:MAG TPA: S24/S26 family peptidase [Arenibaculum sp.]|nr:S24/S26 family peptidase [Arenibaculum sp.]